MIGAYTPLIARALEVSVPTVEDLDPTAQLIIDGTLLQCWSWADHPELYSGKHRTTGVNVQVACTLSSPGFCGGWFIWCWWLPVVIVRGGGGRVPRRLRARLGFACRWRGVVGWCPYQCTHSAVVSTGGVDVLPRALVADQLGLVQGVERLGQGKAERSRP